MDWRFQAACRVEEPELFFPVGTKGPALVQLARAKSVCRRCPVLIQCRSWAMTTGQAAGVWGGMSEDERRAMRREAVDLLLPGGLRVAPQVRDRSHAGAERSGRCERQEAVAALSGATAQTLDGQTRCQA